MLAMVTEMNIIPHKHFGMPGDIQKHTLVYTVVCAAVLAAFFDLSRIASLGAIFYLVMDMAVHWGVLKHLRSDVNAKAWVLVTALVLDLVVLLCFIFIKGSSDPLIIVIALVSIVAIFGFEKYFLASNRSEEDETSDSQEDHHHS